MEAAGNGNAEAASKVVLDHAEEILFRRADSDLIEPGRDIGLDGVERVEDGRGLGGREQSLFGQHDGVRVIDAHEMAPMVTLHVLEQRPKHRVSIDGRGESGGGGHAENMLPWSPFSQSAFTHLSAERRARS